MRPLPADTVRKTTPHEAPASAYLAAQPGLQLFRHKLLGLLRSFDTLVAIKEAHQHTLPGWLPFRPPGDVPVCHILAPCTPQGQASHLCSCRAHACERQRTFVRALVIKPQPLLHCQADAQPHVVAYRQGRAHHTEHLLVRRTRPRSGLCRGTAPWHVCGAGEGGARGRASGWLRRVTVRGEQVGLRGRRTNVRGAAADTNFGGAAKHLAGQSVQ